jgi:hypothetical protein
MFAVAALCGVKIDLKSAYRAVPICANDVVYHAAVIDGCCITFKRLSFGMAQSPVIFVHLLDVTLTRYRQSMPNTVAALSQFVDDSGLAGKGVVATLIAAEHLLTAFIADGWWFSVAKTFLLPATRLAYTGFIASFPDRRIVIRLDKLAKAARALATVTRPLDSGLQSTTQNKDHQTYRYFS